LTVPIVHDRGSAAAFHQRSFPDPASTQIWLFEVDRPALVLGSTQSDDVVDAAASAAAGVEVVRRRSGGGMVLLRPGEIVWFDVIVPAEELHHAGVGDDVAASMIWLGEHVAGALSSLGVGDTEVHRDRMACSEWCPLVCFAGLGPGEVSRGGDKLVGISQRRTRAGSRFQCAVHTVWSPEELVGLLTARPSVGELPPVAVLDPDMAAQLPDALATALTA
jgi:lipoate---protein ligase